MRVKTARNTVFSGFLGLFNDCFQSRQTLMRVEECIDIGNNSIIKELSA